MNLPFLVGRIVIKYLDSSQQLKNSIPDKL